MRYTKIIKRMNVIHIKYKIHLGIFISLFFVFLRFVFCLLFRRYRIVLRGILRIIKVSFLIFVKEILLEVKFIYEGREAYRFFLFFG